MNDGNKFQPPTTPGFRQNWQQRAELKHENIQRKQNEDTDIFLLLLVSLFLLTSQ